MCLPTRWSTWETLLRNNKRRKHSLLLSFPCLHTLPERFLEVSKHSLVSRSNYFQGQRCPPGHLYLGPQFWEREVLQPSLGSCFLVLEALEADWFGSYFKVLFTSPGVFTRARRSGSSTAVLPLLVWTLSALAVETLQCRGGTGLGGMSVSSVTCTSLCTSKGKDRVDVVFFFYFFFYRISRGKCVHGHRVWRRRNSLRNMTELDGVALRPHVGIRLAQIPATAVWSP